MFGILRRRAPYQDVAERLYAALATQARQPVFFAELGVPDTVDGRFDSLALHAWMVIDRTREEADGTALAQALFDAMFGHLDSAVREMGAQDLGVGRRIKVMAEGLHGRALAYRAATADPDPAALEDALRRNLFGKTQPAGTTLTRVTAYVRASTVALAGLESAALRAGALRWPPI